MSTALALVAEAYACGQATTIRSHPVDHDAFRRFSAQCARLRSQLGDVDDPYWQPLLRHLRRIRFELAATPVAFDGAGLGLQLAHQAVQHDYARTDAVYPQLVSTVNDILGAASGVLSSSDAPLLDRLADIATNSDTTDAAIVLCEARLAAVVEQALRAHPLLAGLDIVSAAQLRALKCYPRLFCIGSAQWFPDHVTAAPRARQLDFIHFRWTPGPGRPAPLFSIPAAQKAEDDGERHNVGNRSVADILVIEDGSPTNDDSWLDSYVREQPGTDLLEEFIQLSQLGVSNVALRHEMVRVIPIALEGGRVVFLDAEDGSSTLVLDLAEHGKSRVRRVPTLDVEEGMFVLLRAGGGGDYVVPVADVLLAGQAIECRQIQREWKSQLRAQVRTLGLFEASIALLDHGALRADESNVRRWMWDRSIRPRDYADFSAIMKLIGLGEHSMRFWTAMLTIDKAHVKAGQLIRRLLLQQVMKSDLSELDRVGSMAFDLPGTGTGQMIACRALKVGRDPILVVASHANRLFTAGERLL